MTSVLRRMLACWAGGLVAVICLCFLPVSRAVGVCTMLALWCVIATLWLAARRGSHLDEPLCLAGLPDSAYRQPVVLVWGDLPQAWPENACVLIATQGCWIRVPADQDIERFTRQLLCLRPEWGRQLSVMVTICPQQHSDTEALTSNLLALRWQISQLRRKSGHSLPLVLNGLVGSGMLNETLWQVVMPGEPVSVWRESSAPSSGGSWVNTGGAMAMQQQVVVNNLLAWFSQFVHSVFTEAHPDLPAIRPTAVLLGVHRHIADALPASLWVLWLQQHTALRQVNGWMPAPAKVDNDSVLPDFILPLLPEGNGITPRQRAARCALSLFTLAALTALCCSAWNNHQLLQRVAFDIHHYNRISMDNIIPKASAVAVLRQSAALLDNWARNGEPLGLGLGLYQGGRLHRPVLDAIRTYLPPPSPPPPPPPKPAPTIIRLDSMSLFDSGKSELKMGSTKVLVNSLVGIKAKPGWLIVVSGHTDNTGGDVLNQTLSLTRAESVRNWMRDTGDVPESCFAVQGYGASRPVATNNTAQGRELNRRVEISLVPQADACQVPGVSNALSQDGDVQ